MLQLLHIENIAVIERADISFRAGFNALTGETGAGKSIVIDSLGAVLGARTSRDLIRTGDLVDGLEVLARVRAHEEAHRVDARRSARVYLLSQLTDIWCYRPFHGKKIEQLFYLR